MRRAHLDTDFFVVALSAAGPERQRLLQLAGAGAVIQMSAVAWYEFCRGPRTPQQITVGRSFLLDDGVIPLSEELATMAAEVFRRLGSPRRRAADIAIGVTAAACDADLFTRNLDDFVDIPGLNLQTP